MCRADKSFDPFAESTVDGIIAGAVTVKVGQIEVWKEVQSFHQDKVLSQHLTLTMSCSRQQ